MNVTGTEQLTDYPHVNIHRAAFEHKGHEGTWLYVRRQRPRGEARADAVAIIPLLDGKLVAIKQFRVPVGGSVIEFPAGLIEPGDGVIETAEKELREETGLSLQRVLHVSPPLLNSPGLTDESAVCVFAEVSGTPSTAGNEAVEDIEILLLTPGEAAALARRDDVQIDGKCWMMMYAAFAMQADARGG